VRSFAAIWLLLIGASAASPAQPPAGGEAILRRVDDGLRAVGDYTAELEITADLEGVSIPPARVRMSFKYPDRTRFDAEGFAIVPREALDLTPATLLDRFAVQEVSRDTLGGDPAYRLLVRGIPGRTRATLAEILVHAGRWTIDRITASLPGRRIVEARFLQERIDGHWLPRRLTVRFSAPSGGQAESAAPGPEKPGAGLSSPSPGGGTVAVQYGSYRLHAGLPDSLFITAPRP
jgi:hypothetical protein